ncbi:hypothetical protein [Auraticoccus monumenti]|uniref:Uncharacterized protein n=1 Tax=Auraticoccus monumenti TaxID=675864 RepID=A0A1G6WDT2_9ACTN|nr:hypothetical protein [Auraticoccus monumenti]SDD64090.1 hypothetical protein SAMN04489747_1418 [Auraticoccus monumenti]
MEVLLPLALGLVAVVMLWLGDAPGLPAAARRAWWTAAAVCGLLALALLVWAFLPGGGEAL